MALTLGPGADFGVIDEFCKERLDLELQATPETYYYSAHTKVRQAGTPLFQAAGWVEPRPTPIVVTALAQGVVERLLVVEGQAVKAGEPVATMIEADARLALEGAEAELRLREADLAKARAELTSARNRSNYPLHLQAPLAEAEAALAKVQTELASLPAKLAAAEANMQAAEALVRQARNAVDVARLRLERMVVRAPQDGRVLRLVARPGRRVSGLSPNSLEESSTIVTLYDPEMLQLRTDTRGKGVFEAFAVGDLSEMIGFTNYLGYTCVILVLTLVSTTTMMAVQDRVQEHAVLQTLGLTSYQIFGLVLVESMILSVAGGVLGVGTALATLQWSGLAIATEGNNTTFAASPKLAAIGLGVLLTVGILAGFMPAMQAASAEVGRAVAEVERVQNVLVCHLATAFGRYTAARQRADHYRTSILPDAQDAYQHALAVFEGGQFEYLRVLQAQRVVAETKLEYVRALTELWLAASDIAGLLLEEEWPARQSKA